jgi:hypothetical protein
LSDSVGQFRADGAIGAPVEILPELIVVEDLDELVVELR